MIVQSKSQSHTHTFSTKANNMTKSSSSSKAAIELVGLGWIEVETTFNSGRVRYCFDTSNNKPVNTRVTRLSRSKRALAEAARNSTEFHAREVDSVLVMTEFHHD